MAEHLTHVELLGTSFTIRRRGGSRLSQRGYDLLSRAAPKRPRPWYPGSDPLKVAIVAALNVVDELFKERMINGTATEEARKTGEIASRLIGQIDRALNPPTGDSPDDAPAATPAAGIPAPAIPGNT